MTTERVQLGVDFGAGTLIIAAAGPGTACTTVAVPGLSREVPGTPPVHIIPSLVWYRDGRASLLGDDAARAGVADSASTARWIRRYLCDASPVRVPAGNGTSIGYRQAAEDLLGTALGHALQQYPGAGVVFAVPPDAPHDFGELLHRIARDAGAGEVSFTVEYQAAAAGCGFVPKGTEPFIAISFGQAVMAAVLVHGPGGDGTITEIARAAGSTGCRAVESWIVRDLFHKFRVLESDPRVVRLLPFLEYEACLIRERLPTEGSRTVSLTDAVSGRTLSAQYAMADLDRVLADHGLASALEECIDRVLSAARQKGYDLAQAGTVLLTGEGCSLPAVQDAVRRCLPAARTTVPNPVDAVARGAALMPTAAPAPDRIARSYALRYRDPATQEHHYRYLVHSGTRYPSAGQVARVVISAAYDGQTMLGIPLCELCGEKGQGAGIELVSDTGGGVRIAGPAADAQGTVSAVSVNEHNLTLLAADPPARRGEPRFLCTFTLDAERNLCLSARDLVTGAMVKNNVPVHRLT